MCSSALFIDLENNFSLKVLVFVFGKKYTYKACIGIILLAVSVFVDSIKIRWLSFDAFREKSVLILLSLFPYFQDFRSQIADSRQERHVPLRTAVVPDELQFWIGFSREFQKNNYIQNHGLLII